MSELLDVSSLSSDVANDNQDPELVRPPMAQRSGSMTTIPVEDARVNDRDDQQSLSAMMERTLEVHDSMLSQLKQNETLIHELQGWAENGAPGILGEQTTSDPGSSSLRGFDTSLSTGQEAINLIMPGTLRGSFTDPVR